LGQVQEEMTRNLEKEKRLSELSILFRSLEPPLAHSDNRHTKVSKKSDKESQKPIGRYTEKQELSVDQSQKVKEVLRTGPKDSIQENNEETRKKSNSERKETCGTVYAYSKQEDLGLLQISTAAATTEDVVAAAEAAQMIGQVLSRSEEGRTVAGGSLGGTKSLDSVTQRRKAAAAAAAALQHRNTRRMNADAKMQQALLTHSRLQAFNL
jgi:hypothetical protein